MSEILIMEDEPHAALAMSQALSEIGHKSDIVRTGSEALDALNETHYDLLVTDIYVRKDGVPVPDGGIKLIGNVRQCARGADKEWMRQLPIIAVSGAVRSTVSIDLLELSRSIGADAALSKPLDYEVFTELVESLLARCRDVTGAVT